MKKQQVVIIHGGDSYDSPEGYLRSLKRERVVASDFKREYVKKWKDSLQEKLGSSFEAFYPKMPNPGNARYAEWKAWFEKMLAFVKPGAIYVGHSLGGIFLAKYLAEGGRVRDPKAVILVAPPIGVTDFRLPEDPSRLAALGSRLHLFFSKDDGLVSYQTFYKYRKIAPEAVPHLFADKGHFTQASFPEIVRLLKKLGTRAV